MKRVEAVEAQLQYYARCVDAELAQALEALHEPAKLVEAMRYAALGGGKRLRPALLLGTVECLGRDAQAAVPAACALELVHSYSLVHDDLPCLDDAPLRRGRPSVHRRFGEALALLAGDALLTMAFELLSGSELPCTPAVRLRLIGELAEAAGIRGMVGGQAAELELPRLPDPNASGGPLAASALLSVYRLKTGALMRAAVRLGAILAGAQGTTLEQLSAFAAHLGLAFQIVDDLLDAARDETSRGTLLGLWGEARCRAEATRETEAALAALADLPYPVDFLKELTIFLLSRRR